jgi:hypothetical protein
MSETLATASLAVLGDGARKLRPDTPYRLLRKRHPATFEALGSPNLL